jgi:hypothetical protein
MEQSRTPLEVLLFNNHLPEVRRRIAAAGRDALECPVLVFIESELIIDRVAEVDEPDALIIRGFQGKEGIARVHAEVIIVKDIAADRTGVKIASLRKTIQRWAVIRIDPL